MSNRNDFNTAFLLHLSAFFGFVFPFGGVIAPLVVWELKKRDSQFLEIRQNKTNQDRLQKLCSFIKEHNKDYISVDFASLSG